VEVAARLACALLGQHAGDKRVRGVRGIICAIANVQLDGQVMLVRHAQLPAKGRLLDTCGQLVVRPEVKSDLAHSHIAGWREARRVACTPLGRLGRTVDGPRDDVHVVHEVGHVTAKRRRHKACAREKLDLLGGLLDLLVKPVEEDARG